MGVILASAIITKAQTIIQDATGVRWPETELLGWINEGQREIVLLKPDSSVRNESKILIAGTKQSIPADGIVLISVVRNMGTTGTSPGKAVRSINRQILDEQVPDWHAATAASSAAYCVYDGRNPKVFYVYPPQPAVSPGYVELIYSAAPADMATVSSAITIDDIYSGSLLDYCLFRAYSKDANYAGNNEMAMAHYQKFVETLSLKEKIEGATEMTSGER
jgi:hypothetical protein